SNGFTFGSYDSPRTGRDLTYSALGEVVRRHRKRRPSSRCLIFRTRKPGRAAAAPGRMLSAWHRSWYRRARFLQGGAVSATGSAALATAERDPDCSLRTRTGGCRVAPGITLASLGDVAVGVEEVTERAEGAGEGRDDGNGRELWLGR